MQLVRHSTIATILLAVAGLFLTFSFGWPVEAGLRVLAFLGSGIWVYAVIAQLFLMQAHTQGEVNRSLNEWHLTLPFPQGRGDAPEAQSPTRQLIEGRSIERLIPVHSAQHSEPSMVKVASTPQREIELPSGTKIPREDVQAFVDGLDQRGHMRKDWIGYKMPSSKVVDSVYFQSLIAAVRVTGEFNRYGQGVKSVRSLPTEEIKKRLHLD